jgi:hypothetical protein
MRSILRDDCERPQFDKKRHPLSGAILVIVGRVIEAIHSCD